MAKSVLSSDTLPKAGRVNEGMSRLFFRIFNMQSTRSGTCICHSSPFKFFLSIYNIIFKNKTTNIAVCREWLVHEDGALAYRLQDEESTFYFYYINKFYNYNFWQIFLFYEQCIENKFQSTNVSCNREKKTQTSMWNKLQWSLGSLYIPYRIL